MTDTWTDAPEADEADGAEAPTGSDSELDPTGYDPADDPASRIEGSAPGPKDADRGRDDDDDTERGGPGGQPFPVSPAAIPSWVKPYGNGQIPLDKMIKVAPLGSGYLVPEAAGAWRNLQNAAAGAGFVVTMTGAYRTYDQQVALFQQRYTTTATGGSSKVWNGTRYWLKPGVAMAAVPGTSNHGWGCAVDVALSGYGAQAVGVSPPFLDWAYTNALGFGWSWEAQSEPWHLRLVTIQAIFEPPPPPPAAPQPILKLGSKGGQVVALQNYCLFWKWGDCGRADGDFGPRTEAAVKVMQTALGVGSDGLYGPKSAAALGAFLQKMAVRA